MKRIFLLMVLCCSAPVLLTAQPNGNDQGTIVRMRMTDCMPADHGFMVAMSGGAKFDSGGQCPEYVMLTDKVVYVISGKTSDQLLPLAEDTKFRLQKNEMLIRIDDAQKEGHFRIKAMMMRMEWEHSQMLEEAAASATLERHLDSAVMREQR